MTYVVTLLRKNGERTTWFHTARDIALARVTALLVNERHLAVTERKTAAFTPTERIESIVFELLG